MLIQLRVLLQRLLLSELSVPRHRHALFLEHVSAELFGHPNPSTDVQEEFDLFYDKLLDLVNNYYPLRTIIVSSRDPDYVTSSAPPIRVHGSTMCAL